MALFLSPYNPSRPSTMPSIPSDILSNTNTPQKTQ